jgi:hypothetical protein
MNKSCIGECGGGQGIYYADCFCSCASGFFGENCENNIIEYYKVPWIAISYIVGLSMILITGTRWLIAFYCQFQLNRDGKKTLGYNNLSARIAIVCGFIYHTGSGIFIIIDPIGYRTRFWVVNFWEAYATLYGDVFLGVLVVYIITYGHYAARHIKEVKMFEKMERAVKEEQDSSYIEQYLDKIKKFKIPFIICVVIHAIVLLCVIVSAILYSPMLYYFDIINIIISLGIYIGYNILAIIYSVKIRKLFKKGDELHKKFRRICQILIFYCSISFATDLIFTIYELTFEGPISLVILFPCVFIEEMTVTWIVQDIFIDWKKIGFFNSDRTTQGTIETSEKDTSGKDTPVLSEIPLYGEEQDLP